MPRGRSVTGHSWSGKLRPDGHQGAVALALAELSQRLDAVDDHVRRQHALDRTLECRVSDLGVTFSGRLQDGRLIDVFEKGATRPQIRFTVASDDLLSLTAGHLGPGVAWATRRLHVEATVLDLLRLRSWI